MLIKHFLSRNCWTGQWHTCNSAARPRRFDETLTLSMVKAIFDINNKDNNIFEGLKIAEAGEEYMQHRGNMDIGEWEQWFGYYAGILQ